MIMQHLMPEVCARGCLPPALTQNRQGDMGRSNRPDS
jgi:hypothetical protein